LHRLFKGDQELGEVENNGSGKGKQPDDEKSQEGYGPQSHAERSPLNYFSLHEKRCALRHSSTSGQANQHFCYDRKKARLPRLTNRNALISFAERRPLSFCPGPAFPPSVPCLRPQGKPCPDAG
jgi:hypothetical protein